MSGGVRSYPSEPVETGFQLFRQWFGRRFARSTQPAVMARGERVLQGSLGVGRQWTLGFVVVDALSFEATVEFEAARAAVEKRLDDDGLRVALWVPERRPSPSRNRVLANSRQPYRVHKPATMDDWTCGSVRRSSFGGRRAKEASSLPQEGSARTGLSSRTESPARTNWTLATCTACPSTKTSSRN